MSWVEKARLSAAAQAVRELRDGITIGLGSGNTVLRALELAAETVKKQHLRLSFVPTRYQMEMAGRRLRLKTTVLPDEKDLDLAIDGADQIQWRILDMVNGGGAALLRDKVVDSSDKRWILVVD